MQFARVLHPTLPRKLLWVQKYCFGDLACYSQASKLTYSALYFLLQLIPEYPTLWIILPVEMLQGVTFAMAYSAGTVHCRRIAPKPICSTFQVMKEHPLQINSACLLLLIRVRPLLSAYSTLFY